MNTAKKTIIGIAILLAVCSSIALAENPNPKLLEIKKIYVDKLGNEEGADLIREKIINRLVKSGQFAIVDDIESADAVLTGAAGITTSVSVYNGTGGTLHGANGAFRLIERSSKEIIWLCEFDRVHGFGSRSSKLADKLVDKLLDDTKKAAKIAKK